MTRYRTLGFFVAVAVQNGQEHALKARAREVNGEFPTDAEEVLRPQLLKDYGTSLTVADAQEFIEWFTTAPLNNINSRDKLMKKLKDLKALRFAWWHVYCPDGKVPEELSMLLFYGDSP